MKLFLAVLAIALPSIAFAQVSPPTVGGRPLVQVQSRAVAAQYLLQHLRVCLEIEDQTKERLDCYDAILPPQPKPSPPPTKAVVECKFFKEEDERLNCFNRFVEKPVVRHTPAVKPIILPKPVPTYDPRTSSKTHYVKRGRGGCGSRGGARYRLPNGKCASRR